MAAQSWRAGAGLGRWPAHAVLATSGLAPSRFRSPGNRERL